LNVAAWKRELAIDSDKEFLLNGIQHGFCIIDSDSQLVDASHPNHRSATSNYQTTSDLINNEIMLGHYVKSPVKPTIISPIGLIPKSDGGNRLIHDCSMPHGMSVNDYTVHFEKYRYETVDVAVGMVKKGYYMAKVDIKAAYRSVAINPDSYAATGLLWTLDGEPIYTSLTLACHLVPGLRPQFFTASPNLSNVP
jgi:hypothetical protein